MRQRRQSEDRPRVRHPGCLVGTIAAPLVVLAAAVLLLWSDTGVPAVVVDGLVVLALVVALVLLAIAGARLGYDETGRERP